MINGWAVLVATVVGFVVSSVWYSVFGAMRARLLGADPAESSRPVPWKIVLELARTAVLVLVFAAIVWQLGVTGWGGAALLALALWAGFPVLILSGAMLWEGEPWRLGLIHSGDWLVKLLAIATVVGIWS